MTSQRRLALGAFPALMVAGMLANVESPPDPPTPPEPRRWFASPPLPHGPFPAWCRTPAARQRWAEKRGAS